MTGGIFKQAQNVPGVQEAADQQVVPDTFCRNFTELYINIVTSAALVTAVHSPGH